MERSHRLRDSHGSSRRKDPQTPPSRPVRYAHRDVFHALAQPQEMGPHSLFDRVRPLREGSPRAPSQIRGERPCGLRLHGGHETRDSSPRGSLQEHKGLWGVGLSRGVEIAPSGRSHGLHGKVSQDRLGDAWDGDGESGLHLGSLHARHQNEDTILGTHGGRAVIT